MMMTMVATVSMSGIRSMTKAAAAAAAAAEEEAAAEAEEEVAEEEEEGQGEEEEGGEGGGGGGTSILDLNLDSLTRLCSFNLRITDLAHLALTCKRMRDAVSADPIWEHQCRERWPSKEVAWGTFQYCGGRNAYRERHIASHKFQFSDPTEWHIATLPRVRVNQILIDGDHILAPQGHNINIYDVNLQAPKCSLSGHSAQITCMRLLPSISLGTSQGKSDGMNNLLATSSMDHTIRLWHNGRPLRTFRGHIGPVTTICDGLLGVQDGSPTIASGGIDGTIRLWTLVSGQKRGQPPLKKTIHAHGLAVKQLVVPEYNSSLLVSAGRDLKVRIWNVTTGGMVRSIKIPGIPKGLVCKGSTCYVAGGSSFMLSDFRSMSTVASVSAHESGILSFATSSCGETICTGGLEEMAKLWDIRNLEEPYAVLGKHVGDVDFVYVDKYKAVTGGSRDCEVYVWDTMTGDKLNTFADAESMDYGLTALTVKGTVIATATSDGLLHYRDFSNCALSTVQDAVVETRSDEVSRFWAKTFDEH